MGWHSKEFDLDSLHQLLHTLQEFQTIKRHRWEHIEDQVQMENNLGSPTEDWIIPPDSEQIIRVLQKDPEYVRLRGDIHKYLPHCKNLVKFLGMDNHHSLDWINFNDPLIGNAALEDGIKGVKALIQKCKSSNYFLKNLKNKWTRK